LKVELTEALKKFKAVLLTEEIAALKTQLQTKIKNSDETD